MAEITPLSKEEEQRISKQIGENLRRIRQYRGMPQKDIAKLLGVSFQQVQKYERGTNRLSLSKATVLAPHLGVTVMAFIDGTEYAAQLPAEDDLTAPQRKRIGTIHKKLPRLPLEVLDILIPIIGSLEVKDQGKKN